MIHIDLARERQAEFMRQADNARLARQIQGKKHGVIQRVLMIRVGRQLSHWGERLQSDNQFADNEHYVVRQADLSREAS